VKKVKLQLRENFGEKDILVEYLEGIVEKLETLVWGKSKKYYKPVEKRRTLRQDDSLSRMEDKFKDKPHKSRGGEEIPDPASQ